jgi:ketosteroid isomerase-like protein
MSAFADLLARFSAAVAARDTAAFAALFTEDACYDDTFFGPHQGRADIAHMLDRFYDGGEAFCWEFIDPVSDGTLAYASYCFSYRSREPESRGRLMAFEGVSRMRLRDGLIRHYGEVIDRGGAFLRLGYADARVIKLLQRYSRQFSDGPVLARHQTLRDRMPDQP